ncbi:MAG TPA: kynureninase [bacterium]|jgi:kynureninase
MEKSILNIKPEHFDSLLPGDGYHDSIEFAEDVDNRDPLSHYREKFHIPLHKSGKDVIYFCGNSLGLQPKGTRGILKQELDDWRDYGVEAHFEATRPWYSYHELLRESASDLVGAMPHEVVMMNSLTVNLHLMLVSFYRPEKSRYKILIEKNAFPSDHYAVESHANLHGYDPEDAIIYAEPSDGELFIRTENIIETIDKYGSEIALVLIGGVNYFTGQFFEIDKITQAAHRSGCVAGFDLAHAAGNLDLKLHEWDVDFAVWCTYKYLNGGPGATAGAYINERHVQNRDLKRLAGWWGNDPDTRFEMKPGFVPVTSADGWQVSNPSIFAMAPLIESHAMFKEVGMDTLRAKSVILTGYLEYLVENSDAKIKIITPSNPSERGCQLSLIVDDNPKERVEKLRDNGVICDFREPNVIRVAPVPFYNTFTDVYKFIEILRS